MLLLRKVYGNDYGKDYGNDTRRPMWPWMPEKQEPTVNPEKPILKM